jgi:hypothetical protein
VWDVVRVGVVADMLLECSAQRGQLPVALDAAELDAQGLLFAILIAKLG